MRKALLLLVIITGIVYSSCKKTVEGPGEIYGKWKLMESMIDIGNGKGQYEKVKGAAKYLIIDKSGRFGGNAAPELLSFKILDSLRIEVTSKSLSQPLTYYYKVSASHLTLNPPCIEGCGLKFERQ